MKKNFMAIASLLIAAMLLVVSCSQEVAPKAELDNGLVEVTLNANAARSALKYNGLELKNVKFEYKLDAKWEPTTGQDPVVGETKEGDNLVFVSMGNADFTNTTASKTVGYISQGLWEVSVQGKIGDKVVMEGKTQVYFNKNIRSVTVYVKPSASANASFSVNVDVNDHDKGDNYKLYYSIDKADGTPAVAEKLMDSGNLDDKGYRNWSSKEESLAAGYYRVTVTMKNGTTVVGGITKGVLLFANDTATLSGTVNSSDFVNGTLNVVYPEVSVDIKATVEGSTEDITTTTTGKKVTYTATIDDSSNVHGLTIEAPTYTWYYDGNKTNDNNKNTFEKTYGTDEPGYKTVTCVVKYTFTVDNRNNTAGESTGIDDSISYTIQADAVKNITVNAQ